MTLDVYSGLFDADLDDVALRLNAAASEALGTGRSGRCRPWTLMPTRPSSRGERRRISAACCAAGGVPTGRLVEDLNG